MPPMNSLARPFELTALREYLVEAGRAGVDGIRHQSSVQVASQREQRRGGTAHIRCALCAVPQGPTDAQSAVQLSV